MVRLLGAGVLSRMSRFGWIRRRIAPVQTRDDPPRKRKRHRDRSPGKLPGKQICRQHDLWRRGAGKTLPQIFRTQNGSKDTFWHASSKIIFVPKPIYSLGNRKDNKIKEPWHSVLVLIFYEAVLTKWGSRKRCNSKLTIPLNSLLRRYCPDHAFFIIKPTLYTLQHSIPISYNQSSKVKSRNAQSKLFRPSEFNIFSISVWLNLPLNPYSSVNKSLRLGNETGNSNLHRLQATS